MTQPTLCAYLAERILPKDEQERGIRETPVNEGGWTENFRMSPVHTGTTLSSIQSHTAEFYRGQCFEPDDHHSVDCLCFEKDGISVQ